jgi:hypothetical protein
MAHENNSPERIAADILVAAIAKSPALSMSDPVKLPEHYREILEGVRSVLEESPQNR